MSIKFISPKKSVNSAFLKLPVPVEKMEDFKLSLKALYGKRDPKKDEEYHKNELQAFLKKIFDPAYLVQVKRPIDLAIYNGNDANAKPAVIIEMKSPTNLSEMFSEQHPNTKALQELVYYFLLEYVHFGNREIKHLVISNFDEYYFFDVKDFIRFFANSSKPIYKQFLMFVSKQTSGNKTSDFYNEIAKPAIDDFLASCDINVVRFNLEDACKNVIAQAHDRIGSAMKHASGSAALASYVIASEAKQSNAACHPERTLEPKAIGKVEESSEVLQVNKVPEPVEGPSAVVEKRVSDLEAQVNTLVYQLYGITDAEEIDAVEKR